jgi:hypothetical protein
MARASTAELLRSLWERLIAPLVTGGTLTPLRPIGPCRAVAIAAGSAVFRAADSSLVDAHRVRHVRPLSRVDSLDEPSPAQWMLAAALNDLLQCTNPSLDGVLSHRSPVLLGKVEQVLEAVEPASTVREALSRHGTFALLFSLERRDTHLRWWCGSRDFRGCEPPARLLTWTSVRKVGMESSTVHVQGMAEGSRVDEPRYLGLLARLLSLTPLTDLAAAGRSEPAFAWTGPTLSLLGSAPGRTLALRALRQGDPAKALHALQRAPSPQESSWNVAVQSVLQELSEYARAS